MTGKITATTCVEFLSSTLSEIYPPCVVEDILAAFHKSATRQYQSCRTFLQEKDSPVMSEALVLEFVSELSHTKGRAPSMIACHLAALMDPLDFGFNITIHQRHLSWYGGACFTSIHHLGQKDLPG